MEKTCKILVAYHKPAKLIKNDVLKSSKLIFTTLTIK